MAQDGINEGAFDDTPEAVVPRSAADLWVPASAASVSGPGVMETTLEGGGVQVSQGQRQS